MTQENSLTAFHKDTVLKLSSVLEGHEERVWTVSWSQLQKDCIASCSGDKTVGIWSKRVQWSRTHILEGAHERTVRSVCFNPTKNEIASASFDSKTAIWEKDPKGQYACVVTLEGHENEVKSVSWSKGGNFLATCSRDKSVWIWEAGEDGDFECLGVLQEHSQDVKMVKWNPACDILASASYDDTIKIWRDDDDEWICAATLMGHNSTIWAIDFNQDGTHLVSVSDDLTMKIWKRTAVSSLQEQWECVQTIENQHQRTIYSVSWCKDKQFGLIATGCGDNCIRVFAPIPDSSFDETPVYELTNRIPEAHGYGDINCVEWEPAKFHTNGKYLASAGDDGNVKIWEFSQ